MKRLQRSVLTQTFHKFRHMYILTSRIDTIIIYFIKYKIKIHKYTIFIATVVE